MRFRLVDPHARLVSCDEVLGASVWNLFAILLDLAITSINHETQSEFVARLLKSLPIAALEQIRVRVARAFDVLRLIVVVLRPSSGLVHSAGLEHAFILTLVLGKTPHELQNFV